MNKWITDLSDLFNRGEPSVLVTVASVRGSAPREVGAKMIVTSKETIGTIGGGQLEYQCTRIACEQLKSGSDSDAGKLTRRFALGANCGQCCGGVVEVLFEKVTASSLGWLPALDALYNEQVSLTVATSTAMPPRKYLITTESCASFGGDSPCPDEILQAGRSMLADESEARSLDGYLLEPVRPTTFNIAIFGAGHVGAASVDVLSRLDCTIRWIDSRRNIFPVSTPDNVLAVSSADPVREIPAMPSGSFFIVMTHNHSLDQEICTEVLQREDFAYCGLIGSLSKRRQFERRMKKLGMRDELLERLVCPIGVSGVLGRKPAEIAISLAAEILKVRDVSIRSKTATDRIQDYLRAL